MKRIFTILLSCLMLCNATYVCANDQELSERDLNAPFGWATCASKSGGSYNVTGGAAGGSTITLQSAGASDMRTTIGNAIKNNDIIIFDGSGENGTDFIVSSNIELKNLSNKTIVGINGARLCTKWYVTPELKALLDAAGVSSASTSSGTGGTLPNGSSVGEEAEYLTRKIIMETYGDTSEAYRKSGVFTISGCSNIIIRNLKFVGPGSIDVGGYDLLTCISSTKHLWVDHCEFTDGLDGNFDITQKSDLVTVSWCTFSYTSRSYMHQNTNLIGSSDSETTGYLNVTWANNIWGAGCRARMPMARVGFIHMLNNYYNCAGNGTACINPRKNSTFVIEGNYFASGVSKIFSQSGCLGYLWANTNYIARSGVSAPSSTDTSLKMPYTYNIYNVQEVPSTLTAANGAGATLSDPLSIGRGNSLVQLMESCIGEKTSFDMLGRTMGSVQKGMLVKNGKVVFVK